MSPKAQARETVARKKPRSRLFFCMAALSVTALQAWALSAYLKGNLNEWGLLALHLAVTGMAALYAWLCARNGRDLRLPLLLLLTTLGAGVLGSLGTLLCAVLSWWYARGATPFNEWYQSMFPEEESRFADEVHRRILQTRDQLASASAPTPFTDVLEFGSIEQKQTVINMVSKHFKPSFAPTLLKALNDSDNAIRVQAATAMARLENAFAAKAQKLRRELKERPADPALLEESARHHDDYAFCGILDRDRQRENREQALNAYRRLLEMRPDHEGARLALGRLLVRQGRFGEANRWFERCLAQGSSRPDLHFWRMECLYRLGRWDDLREQVQLHHHELDSASQRLPERLQEALKLWIRTESQAA